MMYNEITASSLVKVNMQGEVEEEGTTNFGVNQVRVKVQSNFGFWSKLIKEIVVQASGVGFILPLSIPEAS